MAAVVLGALGDLPGYLRRRRLHDEVVAAITRGNTISPSGNVRIGERMPMVPVNSVVGEASQLGDVPIRSDGTRTVYVREQHGS